MDVRPAIFIRDVEPSEPLSEVVNEAKAFTWTHRCEHALLRVDLGRLVLVRGGADGLAFESDGNAICVMLEGKRCRVTCLAWHTHPRPTGPSDHDRLFLQALGQPESLIYEMFGDRNGTRFYAEHRKVMP